MALEKTPTTPDLAAAGSRRRDGDGYGECSPDGSSASREA